MPTDKIYNYDEDKRDGEDTKTRVVYPKELRCNFHEKILITIFIIQQKNIFISNFN